MIIPKRKKSVKTKDSDLFANIKAMLTLGRLLFLIPCDGLSWRSHEQFSFRRKSFSTAGALVVIIWCIVKDIASLRLLLLISYGGVVGYVHPAHYFVISVIITFIYIYCFINSHKLKRLFLLWDKASAKFSLKVFSLRIVCWLALCTLLLPFTVNALFSIDGVYRLDGQERLIPENYTGLEFCYEKLMRHWHSAISYCPYFAILSLVDFVFASLPRSFMFPLVITFSYALSMQFKNLYETGLRRVRRENGTSEEGESESENSQKVVLKDSKSDKQFWIDLVNEHNELTELVGEFDSFLSPLIFITYFTSLYLICMQLLRGLSTSMGTAGAELTIGLSPFIYKMSFFVETFLLYFMSISAAQVNDYAHKIGKVLRQCPPEYHSSEVIRLENRVNFGPRIGFTGLGCFVITKPFLLAIANSAITLEIILLQAQITNPFSAEVGEARVFYKKLE